MKLTMSISPLAICLALFLPVEAFSADEKRITTEKEFRELVVGRLHSSKNGTAMVTSDNKLTGTFRGKSLTGLWNWTDNTYCRTVQLDGQNRGFDCQVVLISGDRIIYVRNNGKGRRSIWTLDKR